jgi:hypothetical protein
MKLPGKLLITVAGLALLSAPLLAGTPGPQRPVLDAARQATPTARWQAAEHLRQAYPGLAKDLYGQLKAAYPNLEHGVVDAALDTWESHPDLAASLAADIEARYGQEITAARRDVAGALEAAFPNFRGRLAGVLEQKGLLATWQRFLASYDPNLSQELRALASDHGWQPGRLRDALLTGSLEDRPILRHIISSPQGHGPQLLGKAVSLVRHRAPGLAADFSRQWLDDRKELLDALRAEFPGAGQVIARTLQAKHPDLVNQILATVEPQTRRARADLRANLDKRLPGFTSQAEKLVLTRYPSLRQELLAILKG